MLANHDKVVTYNKLWFYLRADSRVPITKSQTATAQLVIE